MSLNHAMLWKRIPSKLSVWFFALVSCVGVVSSGYSQDLVLTDTTITDFAVFPPEQSVIAGPDFTIANTGKVIFKYSDRVLLRPPFIVVNGGELHMIHQQVPPSDVETPPREQTVPGSFALHQNYPNPFNPETTIEYALPEAAKVDIAIYNILGQKIQSMTFGNQTAGRYRITWNGQNERGVLQSSGVYIYRIVAGAYTDQRKMLLIR